MIKTKVSALSFLLLLSYKSFAVSDSAYLLLKKAIPPTKENKILVFVYNKSSDCAICNIGMSTIFQDSVIAKLIPYTNRIIVMMPVRKIEMKQYVDQFSFLKPTIPILFNEYLYNYYRAYLPETAYQGGVVVISNNGQLCNSAYNNLSNVSILKSCIDKHK